MSTPVAIRSAGTLVKVRISGVYTLIPSARGFTGPGGEAPEIETTPLDETQAKTYLTDLTDPGNSTVKLDLNLANSVHQYLADAWLAGTVEKFEVTYQNGTGWRFDAIVKGLPGNAQPGQTVSADMSLRITGAPARF